MSTFLTAFAPPAWPLASVDPHVEKTMVTVLIQLVVIILASRVLVMVFRRVGQPAVVGEIIGGLMLGPSFLGKFFPDVQHAIFTSDVEGVFNIISQIGLVLLLFLIGLEFDFSHLKQRGKASLSISLTGIVLPFVLGYLLAEVMHPYVAADVNETGFKLFMGTAMSITAIPILGRILIELNLTRTRMGALTITAAAFDDAAGWIILAAVSAVVQTQFDLSRTGIMIAMTTVFAVGLILVVKPLLTRLFDGFLKRGNGDLGFNGLAVLFAVLFLCALITNLIGIFSIFGAFLLGAAMSTDEAFKKSIMRNLNSFVTVFFLPIFFTYTGLRTDIGTLETPQLWFMAVLVLLVAMVGKFGGCTLAARYGGLEWRESVCIGVMMNTRALMELIVINVGYDLGVVPKSVFCMLVIMAVTTTVITTPLLLGLLKKTELQSLIDVSSFARLRPRRKPYGSFG